MQISVFNAKFYWFLMILFIFLKFSKNWCHACKLPDAQTLRQVIARQRQAHQCEAKHSFCSGKLLLCQTNLQILRIFGRNINFPPIFFAHLAASFPTRSNYSGAGGSTSHLKSYCLVGRAPVREPSPRRAAKCCVIFRFLIAGWNKSPNLAHDKCSILKKKQYYYS